MRGRPKTHADNAEKQRAYRERQKALRLEKQRVMLYPVVEQCVTKFNNLLAELEKHGASVSVWYRGNDREDFLKRKIELSRELLAIYDAQPEAIHRDYHTRYPLAPDEYPRHFIKCSISLGEWLIQKEYSSVKSVPVLETSDEELSADD